MAVCSDSLPGDDTAPPKSAVMLRERLAEIESEMAPIQARLAHLATARKLIVDALESIVFPILRIPPEITAEFFVHYVDWANGDPRTRRGGPLAMLLLFFALVYVVGRAHERTAASSARLDEG
ncbi:hypothetical protein GGX14DRAFT_570791 [Mycena pura]|uniref:Uncharacterized protein n=1 Tax=Mycena pura TaxID=153505 RepID=A0AAD6Y8J1_9AGAR|nr:hypothetical protein GGX14DRAFT_570791 [Mycena pura]